MSTTHQHPFRSVEERRRDKSLEAHYRAIGSRPILAALQIRSPAEKPAAKRGKPNGQ